MMPKTIETLERNRKTQSSDAKGADQRKIKEEAGKLFNLFLNDEESNDDQVDGGRTCSQKPATDHTEQPKRKSADDPRPKEKTKKSKTFRGDNDRTTTQYPSDISAGPSREKIPEQVICSHRGNRGSLTLQLNRAPLAEQEDTRVTPDNTPVPDFAATPVKGMGMLRCNSENAGEDEVDGPGNEASLSHEENSGGQTDEDSIEKIVIALREIGDSYNRQMEEGMTTSVSAITVSILPNSIQNLVSDLTYENFQKTVTDSIGAEPSVKQFVFACHLAKAAARKLGSGGAAQDVQRYFMDFIGNNMSNWVIGNGGWRGVAQMLRLN